MTVKEVLETLMVCRDVTFIGYDGSRQDARFPFIIGRKLLDAQVASIEPGNQAVALIVRGTVVQLDPLASMIPARGWHIVTGGAKIYDLEEDGDED